MFQTHQKGFSLVEVLVATSLGVIILTAGSMLFVSGQTLWLTTATRADLQQSLRSVLSRLSEELQESGFDSLNNFQVTVQDGLGVNNTDIIRFSIPLCVCGSKAINEDGEVKNWGAPLSWGQSGCDDHYTVTAGQVEICHVPAADPDNPVTIDVDLNAVEAHLTHGDWIGDCNNCNPANYNNTTIEYLLDASGQILRRVLDPNSVVINSVVFARDVSDFQVTVNAGQTVVTVNLGLQRNALANRLIHVTGSTEVFLKNRG